MKSQQSVQEKLATTNITPKIVKAEGLLDRMKELYHSIANRAYEFFAGRGYTDGHDLEDWLWAEKELLHPLPLEVKENDTEFTISAEVPGFEAEDLKVSIEPNRLIINGKVETESKKGHKKTAYTEFQRKEIFRTIDLPVTIKAEQATATLKNGILTLILPKVVSSEPKEIEVKSII